MGRDRQGQGQADSFYSPKTGQDKTFAQNRHDHCPSFQTRTGQGNPANPMPLCPQPQTELDRQVGHWVGSETGREAGGGGGGVVMVMNLTGLEGCLLLLPTLLGIVQPH